MEKAPDSDSWVHGFNWHKTRQDILGAVPLDDQRAASLRRVAEDIAALHLSMGSQMEQLSQKCCPGCEDVCCLRATVWYDVKDLLFLYFWQGTLPEQQIFRRSDGACCNLTSSGCKLARWERPFICTWYLCPAQKKELHTEALEKDLLRLKELRKNLARKYDSLKKTDVPIRG